MTAQRSQHASRWNVVTLLNIQWLNWCYNNMGCSVQQRGLGYSLGDARDDLCRIVSPYRCPGKLVSRSIRAVGIYGQVTFPRDLWQWDRWPTPRECSVPETPAALRGGRQWRPQWYISSNRAVILIPSTRKNPHGRKREDFRYVD